MRHWGQPLRWNLWAGFFTSPSAFLSFWTVFGRPGALACKGGVLLVREGLGFLKFRCTCHLLLFLLLFSTTLLNKSVSLQYGLIRLLPDPANNKYSSKYLSEATLVLFLFLSFGK